ncbi:uncharacterized protein LOC132174835 [Corylus avellana]|uniref:uncharacterized protein LOC132174835 n=1 Tax=Corylus avellana TaxID=13451 RepID=UPI001E1F624A|nr:uncharacterized protein LOC132174835 [Corylus avellana]
MANDWSALFDKMLSDRDLRVRRITTSWRQHYVQFASSIPNEIFNHPRPPSFTLNFNTRVLFRGAPHDDLLLVYSLKPGKAKFMLHLPGNVDFNPHRRIDAYYRWVDNLLEIKLQPAFSPQAVMDLNDDLTQFHLLAETQITPAVIINKEICLPQMDVRPFYNICTEELQQAINDGSFISVQVFPPVEMVSYGADIRFEKGQGVTGISPLEYCKVFINITNYLANRGVAPEFDIDSILRIWYRRESKKLKLAFTRQGDAEPVVFVSEDAELLLFPN